MKDKIELKDISRYLPYGLTCYCTGMADNDGTPSRCKIVGYWLDNDKVWINIMHTVACYYVGFEEIKPILRPMTDLGRPIVVKGYNHDKEFTPIVELARAYSAPFEIVEVLKILSFNNSTSV